MKKYADVRIEMTVCFDDDEELALPDQAIEAAQSEVRTSDECNFEVVGAVRDTP